jgi:hypothetical protein
MKQRELRRRKTLEYVRDMALELMKISTANGAATMAFLFDMAYVEANIILEPRALNGAVRPIARSWRLSRGLWRRSSRSAPVSAKRESAGS